MCIQKGMSEMKQGHRATIMCPWTEHAGEKGDTRIPGMTDTIIEVEVFKYIPPHEKEEFLAQEKAVF